ncbi:MAG: aspartate kinase [Eubacteriales bacterium]|nr:aspartate kinase [Eubacteriales bacterium]
MSTKVVKFGGSSLADAQQFRKVIDIIRADETRRFVVPSAPGKRFAGDEKVTDMLYACHRQAQAGEDCTAALEKIRARYQEIIDELGLSTDLTGEFDTISQMLAKGANADYAASRGEYLNGIVLADALGYPFVDAAKLVKFQQNGNLDNQLTYNLIKNILGDMGRAVIPGFYGALPDGKVKTFSRGGSDISGSLVAWGVQADLYENWTDVSGVLMADPRIVKNAKKIDVITYMELRELSYMGATVLHEDAIFPVRMAGIPIHIKNTNRPQDVGTLIVAQTDDSDAAGHITGVAGRKGFSFINLEKDMMNSEIGFGYRVLGVLAKHGVSFEHLPTGIDTLTVVLESAYVQPLRHQLIEDLCAAVNPDSVAIEDGMALIATVGRGMVKNKGTAARIFEALTEAGINIRMIDQGSSEMNIIIGVEESDFENAIAAIYQKFA